MTENLRSRKKPKKQLNYTHTVGRQAKLRGEVALKRGDQFICHVRMARRIKDLPLNGTRKKLGVQKGH